MIFPYLGSVSLYQKFVEAILNQSIPSQYVGAKLSETIISAADGSDLALTVPLCGGARACRTTDPDSWIISDHGRWPRIHLGALNAAYSRTPYYDHYAPELASIIRKAPGNSFVDFSQELHQWAVKSIDIYNIADSLRLMMAESPTLILSRAEAIAKHIMPHRSVCELIFKFGPEAIFLLASSFYE